jgi:hypothetical protein
MEWLVICWDQPICGVPTFQLRRKLKAFKAVLKGKTSICYGDLKAKVNQARARLDMA